MIELDLGRARRAIAGAEPVRLRGRVSDVIGLVIEGRGPLVPVGALCRIERHGGGGRVEAEVVGFRSDRALLMPLGDVHGIEPGNAILALADEPLVAVGTELLGRVVDGLGRPLDGAGPLRLAGRASLQGRPLNPLERAPIREPLDLGIRAINGLLTCGRGQRVGIFSGSGVGKSSLLGMIARATDADVNVIALIGERGREVIEFLERDLGEEGRRRSVVVVATSDQPPLVRIRGALTAAAIAEFFRDEGRHVMLMMDSLTRLAMAQREVGLSIGEPPSSRGYTPSVFASLPRLLERAGRTRRGSVTGLYTVLVEGDDLNEPISDAARGLLDGHIVLSRSLANQGHFPAIDVLASVSRLMTQVASEAHLRVAQRVRGWLATYREVEDLIQIGAYQPGANPVVDEAIARREPLARYLRQGLDERVSLEESVAALEALAGGV